MEIYTVVCAFSFLAGFVNGLCGFGAGIILMIVLPFMFPVVQSASIVTAITLAMSYSITWRYRAHLNRALIVKPALIFTISSFLCINLAMTIDQTLMKLLLGIFLLVLSIYFLFVKGGGTAKLSCATSLLCIVVSGVCDGLFGIGGPLMVVYYLAKTESVEEYLGTLQAFFSASGTATFFYRISQGLIAASVAPMIAAGAVIIMVGAAVAARLVARLDAETVRKLTYLAMGVAGAYNIVVSAAGMIL